METYSALLALCVCGGGGGVGVCVCVCGGGGGGGGGEVTGYRWISLSKNCNEDVFFDLRLNKWLIIQSIRPRYETPSRSLWRHRNARGLFYWLKVAKQASGEGHR